MKKTGTILTIAKKEYREASRNKILWLFAGITWLLIIFAAFAGWQRQKGIGIQKQKATALFRHEWEEQEANPHSAAHFGTYLFKPSSVLEIYDHGLNSYLGNTYRVEAHVQHEVNHSEAEHADTNLRFGELSVAMVLQLLLPLMILLMSFSSITREREGNTLKILMIQGGRPARLVWGKLLGIYAIVLTVVVPALLLLAIPLMVSDMQPGSPLRFALFVLTYLVYFFLFTVIGLFISAISRSSNTALATSLGIWVLLAVLLPRATIRWIDSAYPLPSRYEFNRTISQAYQQGMDKDGTSAERWKKFMQETLKKYGVDTVTKLPVNFDGLAMQMGEDYNSKVYDRFAGQVEQLIKKQQTRLEQWSILNPFQAMQQLSMGMAGSDYFHHLYFHHQARSYRDEFVRTLNLDLANSGSAYLSYNYTVGPDFFKRMKDFIYQPPSLKEVIRFHQWSLFSITFWCGLSILLFIPLAIRLIKI